jgi:hypothetical protein
MNLERDKFSELNTASKKASDTIQSFYKATDDANYLAMPADKREELKKAKEAVA